LTDAAVVRIGLEIETPFNAGSFPDRAVQHTVPTNAGMALLALGITITTVIAV
jgi:hypothetical protein